MSQYIDELKKFSPEKFLQKNLNIFNKRKHSFLAYFKKGGGQFVPPLLFDLKDNRSLFTFEPYSIRMNRDLYIDFAKGLATLSIIFIHTAFGPAVLYSCGSRVFSCFDVALFYASSGIIRRFNIEKTFYRLAEAADHLYDLCNTSVLFRLFI
jgi:hypothetical protein